MWDVTCVDTFAPSYATMVSDGPGCIANRTEYLKKGKYASLEANYFLYELGVCLKTESSDPRAYISCYNKLQLPPSMRTLLLCLVQALSVTIIYIYIY